nr:autophagy-related protein 11-like [Hydra vulgaris]
MDKNKSSDKKEFQLNTEASEISVKLVREIFSEMFKKQQKDILKLISGNLKITNKRIDGLLKEIAEIKETCKTLQIENNLRKSEMVKTNDRVSIIEHSQKDIEHSITFTQDIQEEKINKIEKKIVTKVAFSVEEKSKLRQLEDRLRRNNLRLEGITESESESWNESEEKVLSIFENKLNVSDVVIERAHRTGKTGQSKPRSIVIKLLNYKDKVNILKNSKKLKGTGIFINEDYSLDTLNMRKTLFEEMRTHRTNGKYSVVIYDKLVVKDFKKSLKKA